MPMEPTAAERDARCPRCGYDLRGTFALWRESCPLDGRCAECGLRFEWAEVIGARAPRPGWCVEYARQWWGMPWRSVRTFFVALWPWGFWNSLKMTHDVQWGRIAAYLVLLVVPLYLFVCVAHGVAAWATWCEYSRIGCTNMPSPASVIAQSVILPYSSSSPGAVTVPGRRGRFTVMFPSPSQQHRVDWFDLEAATMLLPFLGVAVLCPAGFLALPVSRRRAKVRYAHIHRVTLYSMTFLLAPIAGLYTHSVLELAGDFSRVARWLVYAVSAATLGFPVLLVAWWSCATGRYLKIRHAWGVGLAVVAMASLATMLTIVLIVLMLTEPIGLS
jgi:hypothetical protein